MPGHDEAAFEAAIEAGLTSAGGYEKRGPKDYDESLALFPEDVTGFLKRQPAVEMGGTGGAARAEDRHDRARQSVEGVGPQGHAPRPAPRVQVLRQDLPHGLFPPEHPHESRGGGELRQEPADHHAPGRLHLGHEEGRRPECKQAPPLHHRRDPGRQRHPRRHR